MKKAQAATAVSFGTEDLSTFAAADIIAAFDGSQLVKLERAHAVGQSILSLAVDSGLAKSKSAYESPAINAARQSTRSDHRDDIQLKLDKPYLAVVCMSTTKKWKQPPRHSKTATCSTVRSPFYG